MITFKKNNDKKKEAMKYAATFVSGVIITLFFVLFVMIMTLYKLKGGNNDDPSTSTVSVTSVTSEVITSNTSTNVDTYKNERSIINNLLDISKDLESDVRDVVNVTYDEDYLYVTLLNNNNHLYVFRGDLDEDINLTLEKLITDKSVFELTTSKGDYESISPINVTGKEVFTTDTTYLGYTYKHRYNYYLDTLHDVTVLSSIGYKDNSYISITNLRYKESDNTLSNGVSITSSDSTSEYYKVLDYLYHL